MVPFCGVCFGIDLLSYLLFNLIDDTICNGFSYYNTLSLTVYCVDVNVKIYVDRKLIFNTIFNYIHYRNRI